DPRSLRASLSLVNRFRSQPRTGANIIVRHGSSPESGSQGKERPGRFRPGDAAFDTTGAISFGIPRRGSRIRSWKPLRDCTTSEFRAVSGDREGHEILIPDKV